MILKLINIQFKQFFEYNEKIFVVKRFEVCIIRDKKIAW